MQGRIQIIHRNIVAVTVPFYIHIIPFILTMTIAFRCLTNQRISRHVGCIRAQQEDFEFDAAHAHWTE